DEPHIAAPIVALSPVLSENDLLECAARGGSQRLTAIAKRGEVSAKLQSAISSSGDKVALATLVGNRKTQLSEETIGAAIAAAPSDAALAEALVTRSDVPITTLADVFHDLPSQARVKLLRALAERADQGPPATPPLEDAEARFVQAVRAGD